MLLIYTALIYLLAPLALLVNAWRERGDPSSRQRWSERWGYTDVRFERAPLWIHAVSMGEVQASVALVRSLQKRYPQTPLLMTTATATGAQRVRAVFGTSVEHAYLPYDMPGAVERFLERVRPALGLIMETEIWPNLFLECGRRGIPIVLASARLSTKSVRRYGRLRGVIGRVLGHGVTIAAQTEMDAERFRSIGAASVQVAGNIKFDIEIPPQLPASGAALRASEFPRRPVWVAASTHEGEEAQVLAAHELICERLGDTLLILVPRHPQRFAAVRELLESRSLVFTMRSRAEPVRQETRVLLVDTLGELLLFYAAADLAFVGGSLVPIGGHNLLEPAILECPVLIGPYNFNAPEIAALLLNREAAVQVHNEQELAGAVIQLLNDPPRRLHLGANGRALVESNRGAVARVLERIESLLSAR